MSPRFSGLPAVKYSPFSAQHIRVYRTSSVLSCSLIQLSVTPTGNAGNSYGFLSMQFISSQRSPSSKTKPTTQNENNVTVTKLIHYTIVKIVRRQCKKFLQNLNGGKGFMFQRVDAQRANSSGTTRTTDSKMIFRDCTES